MQDEEEPMQRLSRGGGDSWSLEASAGAFLAQARPLEGLDSAQIALVERRLRHPPRALRALWLWPVLVTVVVLLMASSVMALVVGWRPRLPFLGQGAETDARPASGRLTAPPPSRRRANHAAVEAGLSPMPSPPALPVVLPPAGEARELPAARRAPRAATSLPPAPVAAAVDSPLSAEARSLSQALATWRRHGQAEAALERLAAHERRFANGVLSVEAKVARAEILLALARREQALDVLDGLPVSELPRARELETIRGELRARVGRCREARHDLSRVVQATPVDDLAKRAAAALAACQ
jgi:hypothetical protein